MNYLISIFILILLSCGNQELEPAKKAATASNDIDGDGLSAAQEKELGSHETIADIPSLAFKPNGAYHYRLSYGHNSKQAELNLQGSYKGNQSLEFSKSVAQISFTPITEITPISGSINLELSILDITSMIKIDKVKNLILNLYIEDEDQKIVLVEDYRVNEYFLTEKLIIENQQANPEALLQTLYHQKQVRVEVVDFEFEHPILEKSIQYSEQIENIKKLNSEIIFLNDYDLKLYSSDISISELMSYYSLSAEVTSQFDFKIATTYLLPSNQRVIQRSQKRQIGRTKTLKRNNGIPVSGSNTMTTNHKEVLIQLNGSRNRFSTNRVTYITPKILGGRCTTQIKRVQSTDPISLNHELLQTIVSTGSIHEMMAINSSTWLIITDQALSWNLPILSSNQVSIGDYNKTCAPLAAHISNYEPFKVSYGETSLNLTISESSITSSSEQ